MPSRPLNRRRFLGCSAAAGIALANGPVAEAALAASLVGVPLNVGLIGLGNRGTTLLRSTLAAGGVRVAAICDLEPRHIQRARGIIEKNGAPASEIVADPEALLSRPDLDAVLIAVPCDLHADLYAYALQAGKHLYAEKPLGLSTAECDRVLAAAAKQPDRVVHVGLQRRVNPRYRQAVERASEIGEFLHCRGSWLSGNGPLRGHQDWLSHRARSGDWMVEQAIHVWDLLCWLKGGPPAEAYGHGHRIDQTAPSPGRDVTDFYSVTLTWADGFSAHFVHSWSMDVDDRIRGMELLVMGSEGLLHLTNGHLVLRHQNPRQTHFPVGPIPDTDLAVRAFFDAIRDPATTPASLATLQDAKIATQVGLLVRQAVDERRLVRWDDLDA